MNFVFKTFAIYKWVFNFYVVIILPFDSLNEKEIWLEKYGPDTTIFTPEICRRFCNAHGSNFVVKVNFLNAHTSTLMYTPQ